MATATLKLPRLTTADDTRPHPGRRLSEAEFMFWASDKTRAEWVDGEVVMMAPANVDHDDFGWWVRSTVRHFIEDQVPGGRVLGPEILMRLPRQRRRRLPDVMYVSSARTSIVQPTVVNGPADLIMEIVSPDSVSRDWREKYLEYSKGGVKEYWVIDRLAGRMEAYYLVRAGKYAQIEEVDGAVASRALKGYFLRTAWVLASAPPRIGLVMRDMGVRI